MNRIVEFKQFTCIPAYNALLSLHMLTHSSTESTIPLYNFRDLSGLS